MKNQSDNIFSKFPSKKGQKNAGNAATFIILVGAVFLLYVLFLPPDIRESLLNPENETLENGESADIKKVLLEKAPGTLDYLPEKNFEYPIPSFNLRKSTSSDIIAEENPFYIKRSWFSGTEKSIRFQIKEPKDTKNVQLSFNALQHDGRLSINLNGYNIYDKQVEDVLIEPIPLDSMYISENNNLVFSVSSPEWQFWDKNEYSIDNLIIAADIDATENLNARHNFFMEPEEARSINSARLIFTPLCTEDSVGRLTVKINSRTIYSSIPDCNLPARIDFSASLLEEEENFIEFSAAYGNYLIDTVSIKTETGETDYPTYYFDLSADEYHDIKNRNDDINITIDMLDNEEFKEAYVLINEHRLYLDTEDDKFTRNIKEIVYEGKNTVQIKPLRSFEITRLRVVLYD
ncbi:MAG: hypothetical protein ACLFPQ_03295 [Candidatus Woesearchaeota archaeon]